MSMTCLEARRDILADPGQPGDDALRHAANCGACAQALARARELNRRLQQALGVPVPPGLAERVLLAQTTSARRRWRWRRGAYGLAAGILLALALGLAWRMGVRPITEAQALERYVVNHLQQEPQSLTATGPVSAERLRALFARYGLQLTHPLKHVIWAMRCVTPKGTGIHLVLRSTDGPVTFIYLPEQPLEAAVALNGAGLHGTIKAFQQGAAVLVGPPGDVFERVARELLASIRPL